MAKKRKPCLGEQGYREKNSRINNSNQDYRYQINLYGQGVDEHFGFMDRYSMKEAYEADLSDYLYWKSQERKNG